MFQYSGSPSVCLVTFLVEAAAAVNVQTLFRETPIAGLLGQATRGCKGRDRRCAGLLFSSALHRPRLSPPGEEGGRGGGHCSTVYLKGADHTRAANYYILPTLSYAFLAFVIGVARIKWHFWVEIPEIEPYIDVFWWKILNSKIWHHLPWPWLHIGLIINWQMKVAIEFYVFKWPIKMCHEALLQHFAMWLCGVTLNLTCI